MFEIIRGNGTGKTKELLEYAWKEHAIVVCKNPMRMVEKSQFYNMFGLEVISYQEFLNKTGTEYPNRKFVIDEVSELLEYQNIIGYTMTWDE